VTMKPSNGWSYGTDVHKLISHLNRIVLESHETITICAPWFYTNRSTSWVNELLNNLKSAIERGVKVNVFLRADSANGKTFAFLKTWGARISLVKNLHQKIFSNEKELILMTANLTDAAERQQESYVMQNADAPEILRVMGELKEDLAHAKLGDEEVVEYLSNVLPALFRQIEQISDSTSPSDLGFADILADKWETLHDQTRRYLTTGQRIELFLLREGDSNSEATDFAPAILEYAKALENELERKIFHPFKLTGPELKQVSSQETDIKIRGALEMLGAYIAENKPLTMGQMAHLLKALSSISNTFRNYLDQRLQDENDFFHVFDFPAKLEKFNYKWRTKAAHPHPLNSEDCKQCRDYLLREPIRLLLYLTTQLT